MKRIGLVLVTTVLLAGFAGTSFAATSLIGTWGGAGSCATPTGYTALTATVKVLSQNTAGLFRGTFTGKIGTEIISPENVAGYLSGVQVRMNTYTLADGLGSLWELTYAGTAPPTLKGSVRGTDGTMCSMALTKK